jgi:HSP20 family protein
MTTIARLRPAPLMPLDWNPFGWLASTASPMRIEESLDEKTYTLRVEMPGVDPARDVTVTYHAGVLRVAIHREDTRTEKGRSEFHYGTYDRVVALPAEVDEHSIAAAYREGILTVTATLASPAEVNRTIPIAIEPAPADTNES